MTAAMPSQEKIKINHSHHWKIGDGPTMAAWDKIARLAAQIGATPVATICLDRGKRQWLPALLGLPSAAIPQVLALCAAADWQPQDNPHYPEVSIVSDTQADDRFATLSLVKEDPKIRFYAAVAIRNPAGVKLGKLCVMGFEPQQLSEKQIAGLRAIALLCANHLPPTLSGSANDLESPQRSDWEPDAPEIANRSCPPPQVSEIDLNNDNSISRFAQGSATRSETIAIAPPVIKEQHLKNLLSHIPVAIYRCTESGEGQIRYFINDEIAEIVGYRRSDFVLNGNGTKWKHQPSFSYTSLIHPEDRPRVEREIGEAIINRQPFFLQYRLLDACGSIKWVSDRGRGIFSSRGELLYIDGIVMESISSSPARPCSQYPVPPSKIAKGDSEIIDPIESGLDAYFALDCQWNVTAINPRAEAILHRNGQGLIGRNFWQEFPFWDNSNLADAYRRVMAQRVRVNVQAFYPPQGSRLEMQAYPKPEGLSVYFQDVTPEKKVQLLRQERDRLGTFSANMGTLLARGGSLSELIDRCCQGIVEHLDAASVHLWIFNPAREELELHSSAGQPLDPKRFPERIALGETAIGIVAQTRQADPSLILPENSHGNLLIQPLIADEQLFGVLALVPHQSASDAVQSLLVWIASTIAVAIDRDRGREVLLSRRDGLLFRLASQIRNSLDLDTILETAVTEIHNLLQIDRCHFLWYLPHPIQASLTVTHESRSPQQPSLLCEYPTAESGPLAQKIRNLESLRIDTISTPGDLDELTRSLFVDMGIASVLLLSLETRSGQLGAVVCSHSRPRPWSDSEVELLQGVVDQLALAIDQAELYAQTHAAALAAQTQAQQLSVALQNLKHTQSQLIQTEKMSSLGQMVAGIAHEINNPVNFITGNLVHANNYTQDLLHLIETYQEHYPEPVPEVSEVAEDIDLDFLTEDLPKILASMQMGADRIRQIVVSLRNFSRLDEAEMKPVDIHEGIDNTLLILHNRWKPKGKDPGVEIVKEYGELPKVECYAGQLNQVFMNILANSMDALENQSAPHIITISTAIAQTDAQGKPSQIAIRIRDNGPGMTEEVKKRLFDPFFTTKPVGKGTGLGLSISYKIVVDKHGGILRCDSEPGKGSEFLIQIPVKQPQVSSRCA